HALFQLADAPGDLARRAQLDAVVAALLCRPRRGLALAAARARHAGAFEDVTDVPADAARHDAVLLVEGNLFGAAPFGLVDGPLHRAGDVVGVEDGLAVEVARRPADGLDQR